MFRPLSSFLNPLFHHSLLEQPPNDGPVIKTSCWS